MGSKVSVSSASICFGDAHGTKLGRDVGAHSACECETRQNRGQLAAHGFLNECADKIRRHEITNGVARQQRQHDAREEGDKDADWQRLHTQDARVRGEFTAPAAGLSRVARNTATTKCAPRPTAETHSRVTRPTVVIIRTTTGSGAGTAGTGVRGATGATDELTSATRVRVCR